MLKKILIAFIIFCSISTPLFGEEIDISLQVRRTTKSDAIKQLGNPDSFNIFLYYEFLYWDIYSTEFLWNPNKKKYNITFRFADG
ncbi:MAG: hypothetical protein LBE31_07125, partial [Deltaproteobacteria bacterium]|nr:hypothetical protein [Deltaproteobacteria bacterium]